MTAILATLLHLGPWCAPPTAPAWVAIVTWEAGDGARCIGASEWRSW